MSLFLDITVDSELLRRAQAGESAAHEQLYRLFSQPVYTLIRRLVVRPAIAEELLQDVFVEVLRHVDACGGSATFAGWVRSIAVNRALMHLRSPWHRRLLWLDAAREPLLPEPATGEALDPDQDLERALNRLPAIARSVVWLHDVEGYTHDEIAELHGRSSSYSKSQLARAHRQLRAWLEPRTGEIACTPVIRS